MRLWPCQGREFSILTRATSWYSAAHTAGELAGWPLRAPCLRTSGQRRAHSAHPQQASAGLASCATFQQADTVSETAAGTDEAEENEVWQRAGSDGDSSFEEDLLTVTAGIPSSVNVGGADWGEAALRAIRTALEQPAMSGLAIYSVRAILRGSRLNIALDKLDDKYGSPSLEDIAEFQRCLQKQLQEVMGLDEAGQVQVEVSSPGAERQVRFPEDLQRFANLPMRVEYMATSEEELPPKLNVAILLFAKMDNQAQIITWHLANVRVNRPKGKGSKLTRRQLQEELSISVADLRQVNLYLDI